MFSWNISRSAEKMFSRWAMKRLCQFLLKKKLGNFILGDIDLDQLDVQLGAGTIQLSDVALNVDYINEKFGKAGVFVKEGTAGMLKVTMPWKEGGCRIELDEVEIVFAPKSSTVRGDGAETCPCSNITESMNIHEVSKLDGGDFSNRMPNASVEVHEGVKTIARLVKWLLTSFHVNIRGLIMAFDPCLEGVSKKGLNQIVVLRISEAECGTQISDFPSSGSLNSENNFLGLSRITNFMRFHGVVLELLLLHGPDDLPHHGSSSGTPNDNPFPGCCSLGNMTTVISGEKGGFSGSLKLSLPWKDGSLDISKVNADLQIEPLELRIRPGTLKSFIFMWEMLKHMGDKSEGQPCPMPFHSCTAPNSCAHSSNKGLVSESFLTNSQGMLKESFTFLLSESRLISDWVNKTQEDRIEEEPEFMASVDQFFECFDELRSSNSALGNSVMWNWTCSVFSAITAASNLASGSVKVQSKQQQGETSFNAVIAKVSLYLFCSDVDHGQYASVLEDKTCNDFYQHCICSHFLDVRLLVQVRGEDTNLEATVQHMQIDDHLYPKKDLLDLQHGVGENIRNVITSMQEVQDGIQSVFSNFKCSKKDLGAYPPSGYVDVFIRNRSNFSQMLINSYDRITLLETFGATHCSVKINSGNYSGSINGRTSFSLQLAPFSFWVNFDLISLIQDYLKDISNIFETRTEEGFLVDSEAKFEGFSQVDDEHPKSSCQRSSCLTTNNALEGNVFLPSARIIFCFPLNTKRDSCSYSSFNHFVVLDITSTTTREEDIRKKLVASAKKRHPVTTPCFIDVNFSDLHLFFVHSVSVETTWIETLGRDQPRFSVDKIASVVSETGHLSLISIFWQGRPATGPWISNKAKVLVSGDNKRNEGSCVDKSSEFASVASVKDNKDFDHQTRQEILLSSELLLHVQLPAVYINLDRCQYLSMFGLLDQFLHYFSSSDSESVQISEKTSPQQISFLVEFGSLMLSLDIEPIKDFKHSMFSELPGSWCSLTLQMDKFEILSVCNIGGIEDMKFLHIAHHQGSLWGSNTEARDKEFILISCSNSSSGRGDGEGLNVLSPSHAGSIIMNLWDPANNHNFTSVTIKCATIIAVGGRLDWFMAMMSFFTPQSSNFEGTNDSSMNKTFGSSFTLTMVDVGLSYEPYTEFMNGNQGSELESSGLKKNECKNEFYVACLLAASSLKISHTSSLDCKEMKYKIRVQDIGFLISAASENKLIGRVYSARYLRKIGYVKVGQEALVEVVVRINCENGHSWEVECTESHIIFNTCQDTTVGVIRLSTQLQMLFAPDMEDYVVHLENRWNNIQLLNENNNGSSIGEFSPAPCQMESSGMGQRSKAVNLMSVVCDDIFHLNQSLGSQGRIYESHTSFSTVGSPLAASKSSSEEVPDVIEEYFSADMRSLSGINSEYKILENCSSNISEGQAGNARWYVDKSLNILENHASEIEQARMLKPFECKASRNDSEHFDVDKAEGCIIIKNLNIVWGMHGGSDWSNVQNASLASARNCSRDSTVCLELSLSGVGVGFEFYPDGGICASKLHLTIQDVCFDDRSVDAPWKMVLGYYRSKKHPRKFSSDAVKLTLETVRPNPLIHVEENRLRIGLLPMRLHLHQSQLDFLIGFFGPDETIQASNSAFQESGNLETFLPYFQKFDILPFTIRVDYHPCRVDLTALRGGKYVELVNLVPWKGVELHLKRVEGVGHYGWNSVLETIFGEWLEDISHNQIHKLLKGLPPIKSIVSIGSGAAKLVSLPVKGYKKDHAVLRGMQRGTFAFLRSISIEAMELGVHLAAGAHNILLQAEYILANIPPSAPWQLESKVTASVKANQPSDVQQGIQQACQSISDGLGKTASALLQTPIKRYQRGAGVGSTLVTAVQSAPAAAVAPASAAARAVHCALLGFRNSLDPEHMRESMEKYMGSPPSSMQ